jgi:BirA family biotin operon repressor/biotin-[acetyl-CoA-carboxylase] ligase
VGLIGHEIIHFDVVESTMAEIDRLAAAGAAEGVMVAADHQTRGRGRRGRVWTSEPGASLLCSLLLRPNLPPGRLGPLPLVAGLAVAEAIEDVARVPCQLKWPNDVLIDGRKVAGILVQSRSMADAVEYVNVGMGINVSTGGGIPDTGTSLAEHAAPVFPDVLLDALIRRFSDRYEWFLTSGGRPDLSDWRRRAVMLDEVIRVITGAGDVRGRFVDVDSDGSMIIEMETGVRRFFTHGEIERGPRLSV